MEFFRYCAALLFGGILTFSMPLSVMTRAEAAQTGNEKLSGTSKVQTETVAGERTEEEHGPEAKEKKVGVRNVGPGLNNLSPEDIYAEYQWGLKNDGQFQYQELVNRFQDSNPRLAAAIDLANVLGIPLDVGGPGNYSVETTDSVKGVDINIQPAWELYCSRSKFLSKIFKINVKNFREIFPDFTHRKRGSDFITVPFLSSGSHALRLPSAFPFSVPCLEYTLSVLQQSNLTPHISGLYALPSN